MTSAPVRSSPARHRGVAELLGKKAPKKLTELAEAMNIIGYRYTFNIVIDEAGIPEHMSPTVAVLAEPGQGSDRRCGVLRSTSARPTTPAA